MNTFPIETIKQCKQKLQSLRAELLNRLRSPRTELNIHEKMKGDEADQIIAQQEENDFLLIQDRVRKQLFEIDAALARIEIGCFGICEETHEPIEIDRLLAIPFTRLSLEGAEIRESANKGLRPYHSGF